MGAKVVSAWRFGEQRKEPLLIIGLIVYATANAFVWSAMRPPIFGGPDEENHFRLIEQMVSVGGWPIFRGYAENAFAGLPIRAQVAYELTPNLSAVPAALLLGVLGPRDVAFDVHLARLVNVTLFPITLVLAYLTVRRIFPNSVLMRMWPVAVMAATPQFTLVFSYVTNDSPAIAASTFGIYALVRAYQDNFQTCDSLLLGLALGLVALHKFTGFMIFPVTCVAIFWALHRTPMRALKVVGLIAFVALAISLWWYVRMWIVYGDPFGVATTQAAVDISGGAPVPYRARGYSLWRFVTQTEWLGENFATFWGGYGISKLKLPGTAYVLLAGLTVLSWVGLVARLVMCVRTRRSLNNIDGIPVLMALLFFGLLALSLWSSYSVDMALHGRYLFPEFLPFVILLAMGLSVFAPMVRYAVPIVAMTIPLMITGNLMYVLLILVPDVVSFG